MIKPPLKFAPLKKIIKIETNHNNKEMTIKNKNQIKINQIEQYRRKEN